MVTQLFYPRPKPSREKSLSHFGRSLKGKNMRYLLGQVGEMWVGLYLRSREDTIIELSGIAKIKGDDVEVKDR